MDRIGADAPGRPRRGDVVNVSDVQRLASLTRSSHGPHSVIRMHRSPSRTTLVLAPLVLVLAACSAGVGPTAEPPASEVADTPAVSDAASMVATPSVAPPSGAGASEPASSEAPGDPLLAVVLTDVRSGETFTLGDLAADEGPVLLEPMAVWCSNCRAQQHEVKRAHEGGAGFTSVSLDVDLSEAPDDLAAYADREGFDWRFAMADAALYRLLQERFGIGATNPPVTPLIVVERDGTVRALEFGVGTRDVDRLIAEIEAG